MAALRDQVWSRLTGKLAAHATLAQTKNRREVSRGGFEIFKLLGRHAWPMAECHRGHSLQALDQFLAAADERAKPFGQELGVERLFERLIDGGTIER